MSDVKERSQDLKKADKQGQGKARGDLQEMKEKARDPKVREAAREVGMDRWAWDQLDPWLEIRRKLPIGALLCVIHGPTAGRRWKASAAGSAGCGR